MARLLSRIVLTLVVVVACGFLLGQLIASFLNFVLR